MPALQLQKGTFNHCISGAPYKGVKTQLVMLLVA